MMVPKVLETMVEGKTVRIGYVLQKDGVFFTILNKYSLGTETGHVKAAVRKIMDEIGLWVNDPRLMNELDLQFFEILSWLACSGFHRGETQLMELALRYLPNEVIELNHRSPVPRIKYEKVMISFTAFIADTNPPPSLKPTSPNFKKEEASGSEW